MKLLVTGRSGQLAQSLAEQKRPGLDIVLAGRPAFDVAEPRSLDQQITSHLPDVVINTAAYTAVDRCESEPSAAIRINKLGAYNVARACADADVPLIHISTDYVFDGAKSAPYVETDEPAPISVYGRSKLEGESEVAAVAKRHVILRTSWFYSPFGINFLKTMLRLADTRTEINVVSDQIGAPTYADHLSGAIVRMAPHLISRPNLRGVYHLTASGETTWAGFAEEIFRLQADQIRPRIVPISSTEYGAPARRPANSRLDCSKFESAFGFRLPAWQSGVSECLARLRAPLL